MRAARLTATIQTHLQIAVPVQGQPPRPRQSHKRGGLSTDKQILMDVTSYFDNANAKTWRKVLVGQPWHPCLASRHFRPERHPVDHRNSFLLFANYRHWPGIDWLPAALIAANRVAASAS
jgi:hypothetical protein